MSTFSTLESILSAQLTTCAAALDELRAQPYDVNAQLRAANAALNAADAVASLQKSQKGGGAVQAALELYKLFAGSDLHRRRTDPACVQRANQLIRGTWCEVLAAMTLAPARSLAQIPAIDELPYEFWPLYTEYLISRPDADVSPGDISAYVKTSCNAIRALADLQKVNRGSAAVSSAIAAFMQYSDSEVAQLSDVNLTDLIAVRSAVSFQSRDQATNCIPLEPISGRKPQRLGVCLSRLSDTPEVWSFLTLVRKLHQSQFQVEYFVEEYAYGPTEEEMRRDGFNINLLDSISPESSVRDARLDVALILVNPLALFGNMHRLGASRVAALQIAYNISSLPTSLPSIDLFLSSSFMERSHKHERIGLLPLLTILPTIDLSRNSSCPSFTLPDRQALGFDLKAKVTVSCAYFLAVSDSMVKAWTDILMRDATTCLLVYMYCDRPCQESDLHAVANNIDSRIQSSGVIGSRIAFFCLPLPTAEDWARLIAIGDIYLDGHPVSCAAGVAAALSARIPIVCWSGLEPRQNHGEAILSKTGMSQYIARDTNSGVEFALRLLSSDLERDDIKRRMNDIMSSGESICDSLAAADSFSHLIELATMEIERLGLMGFRESNHPLRAVAHPDQQSLLDKVKGNIECGDISSAIESLQAILGPSPQCTLARVLMAEALSIGGDTDRALTYHQALVNSNPANPSYLTSLGFCYAKANREREALLTLEKSIRLDANQPAAWLYYAKAALRAGNLSLTGDIIQILHKIAPSHEETLELERQLLEPAAHD